MASLCKVVSLFNQSGGVGKSTLAINISYLLAKRGYRVLAIDMDPQASLTIFMGLEPEDLETTIYNAICRGEPAQVHTDIHGINLIPSNIQLCGAELELVMADLRDFRLQKVVKLFEADYDYILIDCPPSLGLLTYISLVACHYILVPIQTQYKAFRGTELLLQTYSRVKQGANSSIELAGFVPTMFSKSNSQDCRALNAIQGQLGELAPVLEPVPRATAFADATERRIPLEIYNNKHPALNSLNTIVDRFVELS